MVSWFSLQNRIVWPLLFPSQNGWNDRLVSPLKWSLIEKMIPYNNTGINDAAEKWWVKILLQKNIQPAGLWRHDFGSSNLAQSTFMGDAVVAQPLLDRYFTRFCTAPCTNNHTNNILRNSPIVQQCVQQHRKHQRLHNCNIADCTTSPSGEGRTHLCSQAWKTWFSWFRCLQSLPENVRPDPAG